MHVHTFSISCTARMFRLECLSYARTDIVKESTANFFKFILSMSQGLGPQRWYSHGVSSPYPAPLLTFSPITLANA